MAFAIPPRQIQGDDHLKKEETGQKIYTMRKQVGNNTYTDHILDQVEKEKDLGVTVDCNLSFEHI